MQRFQIWVHRVLSVCLGLLLWLGLVTGSLPAVAAPLIAGLPPGNAVTDPSALLRLSLPIDNDSIRKVQTSIEDISTQVRGRRWSGVKSDVAKASSEFNRHKAEILASVPETHQAQAEPLMTQIESDLAALQDQVSERNSEEVFATRSHLLTTVGALEALMVEGFPFDVPAEYSALPQLKGRATVEMETTKGPLTVVADGYSAPVTAGNFVDLVQRGFYNGLPFTRAEESYVLQTGDPEGSEVGFIDPKTKQYRAIPLEILLEGDTEPLYGTTLEDAGRYLEHPVLPFSAYGTVALARPGDDPNGGSSQFFFLLFQSELTPAGANLLDGRYAVFGYAVDGKETLGQLRQGDKILSAKVTQGLENLVQPS
ncbi:peptidylprolyl isomerase [Synechococcales cyanobacterium C]|uniref:peptidylprolyl isomerase n=1 Tax=Petrachloros mirabilis ULC683 TaxID=2781853 RepID=A0A8K1ZXD5_9CYAN|nr:peptidylprolyl isomerase [Petrachloros mirabilis]NCJ05771.1 peptidylprolyl isomerase [Petrachloros mirabilis ULC683]